MTESPGAADREPAPCPACGRFHPGAAGCPPPGSPEPMAGGSVNLATLMLLIAVLAVGLALLDQAPLLGGTVLLFAGVALVRTAWNHRARRLAGRPMSRREQVRMFLLTFAALGVISLSGLIAFSVVCFPIGLASFRAGAEAGIWIAMIVGVAAGLVAMWFTFRLIRRWGSRETRP